MLKLVFSVFQIMYNADRSQSNLQFNSSAQTEMPQAQEFLNMSGHGHEMICFQIYNEMHVFTFI